MKVEQLIKILSEKPLQSTVKVRVYDPSTEEVERFDLLTHTTIDTDEQGLPLIILNAGTYMPFYKPNRWKED